MGAVKTVLFSSAWENVRYLACLIIVMRDCLLNPANKLQGSLENFFLVICHPVYDQSGSIVFKVLLFGLVKDGSRQTLQEILSDKEKKYEVGDVFEYIIDVAHGSKLFNQDMLFGFISIILLKILVGSVFLVTSLVIPYPRQSEDLGHEKVNIHLDCLGSN